MQGGAGGRMIQHEIKSGVYWLTIARPEKANSLTAQMLTDIAELAEAAQGARGFVITGAGTVFSAGADLGEARAGLALSPLWERVSGAVAALPCLSICALNGALAGGAMGMALACDLRICVPQTQIFYPVMRLGFLPQPSDPARLRALIGPARTKMILMAGQKISAEEALTWGLVERIVAPESLLDAAGALLEPAATADPAHAAAIKALI